ncbi:MAG: cytochrome c oxidase subunit II [Phycisphaerales bacterium]|nr:cytochrome c oxidase subunit II [Phycisphaerae bacterium]NNF41651.1 cytochrome c oxidase subunit II [Phycisphaerales bacterium]NNM27002.1 cytochrome c oxidase subunit II [Phycisphaerales bacterium]
MLLRTLTSLLSSGARVDTGDGFWLPPQASTYSQGIDWVFYFIYWICVFFFVLIVALMILFVWKYRRTSVTHQAGETVTHHTPLELTWTIIPLILVIAIFWIGLDGYVDMIRPPANAYEVNVVAQRWNWSFEHRNGAQDSQILKVPAGRPVKLVMTSQDVLHALFIPAFRAKQDVVPGRYTTLWFEAKEPGLYQLFCAEYCGTQHSQMGATVAVYPPDEFDEIIAKDARWLDNYTDENLYQAGLRIFARCSSCHSLQEEVRLTGPSFWDVHDDFGKKRLMEGDYEADIDENYIQDSILNPQKDIVATYQGVMPTFQGALKPREVRAMVEFLKRLDEVVDRQGNPIE